MVVVVVVVAVLVVVVMIMVWAHVQVGREGELFLSFFRVVFFFGDRRLTGQRQSIGGS